MKKLFFAFVFAWSANVVFAQSASKIIYSNSLTHCYVTAYSVNDSTLMYNVSEKSDRNVWRITDREEVQSLGLLDEETTIELFKRAIGLFESKEIGKTDTIGKNIKLSYQKIMGMKCVQVENTLVGSSFNINQKTAIGALRALGVDPDEE